MIPAILYQVFSSAPIISPMIAILSLHGLLAGGGALWACCPRLPLSSQGCGLCFWLFTCSKHPTPFVNPVHTKEAFEISLCPGEQLFTLHKVFLQWVQP